jgi:hypothetical protein
MDATKPPSVGFWNIGEKNCDPVKVQIKPTMFRQMQQLYTHLASKIQGCGGGVRALYTPQGQQIKDIGQFTDGEDVVVCPSGVQFNKANLPLKLAAKIGTG